MSYIVLSDNERMEMIREMDLASVEDLFREIPVQSSSPDLPRPLPEQDVMKLIINSGKRNRICSSFLGAGIYNHHIPAAVDHLSSRSEFFTSYTPYQAEVSQGTLTAIFEFQTCITRLTGLDIANASLYDGATSLAEAILMAVRTTGKRHILVSHWLHPHYMEVIRTYCRAAGIEIDTLPGREGQTLEGDITALIRPDTAAIIIQTPSFTGMIEDVRKLADTVHDHKSLLIVVTTEALSLAFLRPHGESGADIVCGELSGFGMPPSYGGPLLGFLAAGRMFLRQMPGRLAGLTTDHDGNRSYCLTLQTREQHVRRERATSNICTNEGLCMLRAVIYLAIMGPHLGKLAEHNHGRAGLFRTMMGTRGIHPRYSGPYFNEMLYPIGNPSAIRKAMMEKGIDPGLDVGRWYPELDDCLLVVLTEMNSNEDIDDYFRLFDLVRGA